MYVPLNDLEFQTVREREAHRRSLHPKSRRPGVRDITQEIETITFRELELQYARRKSDLFKFIAKGRQ